MYQSEQLISGHLADEDIVEYILTNNDSGVKLLALGNSFFGESMYGSTPICRVCKNIYLTHMDSKWIQEHMQLEGVRLLSFRSKSEISNWFAYAQRYTRFDLFDVSVVFEDLNVAEVKDKLVTLVEQADPELKKRSYAGKDELTGFGKLDRTNFYANEEKSKTKVIGIAVVDNKTVRVQANGVYAELMSQLFKTALHLPVSLQTLESRPMRVKPKGLNVDRLERLTGKRFIPPPITSYFEAMPEYIRAHRLDVCIDVSRTSTSFNDLVNAAMIARNSQRGRKAKAIMLGNEEFGRTVYIGSNKSPKQLVLYEKRLQTLVPHYALVHTRIEFRFRPHRNKDHLPELSSLLSAAEVMAQCNMIPEVIREAKRPTTTQKHELTQDTNSLLF